MADRCWCEHAESVHTGREDYFGVMPTGCVAPDCGCRRWVLFKPNWRARIVYTIAVIIAAGYVAECVWMARAAGPGHRLAVVAAFVVGLLVVFAIGKAIDLVHTRCVTGRWWW